MSYVPYETISRVEADEILGGAVPNILSGLSQEHLLAVRELLTDAYARGLEAGFAMSEFNGDSPGDMAEAYAAGFEQGKIDDKGEQ